MVLLCYLCHICFNPRTHTGCDGRWSDSPGSCSRFQSTHPHGVRLLRPQSACQRRSFNPRTHTGCDLLDLVSRHPVVVSIHAPTRGATQRQPGDNRACIVSIHAPTRGATEGGLILPVHVPGFNPRTHTGCDSSVLSQPVNVEVSIHAPTRGATLARQEDGGVPGVSIHAPTRGATLTEAQRKWADEFQSTHPHGVRRRCSWNCFLWTMFQSTHPHGVRPLQSVTEFYEEGFNPRTHTGCDYTYI